MRFVCFLGLLMFSVGARAAELPLGQSEVLQKKCLVELKYQFIPNNCFRWIKNSKFNEQKKIFLRDWFNSVCKKSLQKDQSVVQFHVQHLGALSKECQKDIAGAFEQWSYKSKVEAPEQVLELLAGRADKAGKDIEYTEPHDVEKAKSNRNLRNIGRRLN